MFLLFLCFSACVTEKKPSDSETTGRTDETTDRTDTNDTTDSTDSQITDSTDSQITDDTAAADADQDGVADEADCDDTNPAVHPGATESCNGVDDNCDGATDEGVLHQYGRDADSDGWAADGGLTTEACTAPTGYVEQIGDCDDLDSTRNPGATEVCDGFTDEDCDGLVDDADPSVDSSTWSTFAADRDQDGYGDGAVLVQLCAAPAGYVSDTSDCNDRDVSVHPGATEVCGGGDEDCDGLVDDQDPGVTGSTTAFSDQDGDGYGDVTTPHVACLQTGYISDSGDCDDGDAAVNPGAAERCDGSTDEDCDGLVDDLDPDVTDTTVWYDDGDQDGYGATAGGAACLLPSGASWNALDCDDGTASVSPSGTEVCDGSTDEDCDGLVDDQDPSLAGGTLSWYADTDQDGYGDPAQVIERCVMPAGYSSDFSDCDDTNRTISPAATEVCDSADVDENCNGVADDSDTGATGQSIWFRDADGDGFGGTTSTNKCNPPSGYLSVSGDCDDASASTSPAGVEVCGGGDEDCDTLIDDADPSVTGQYNTYADADGDGYGDAASIYTACVAPANTVSDSSDCDDGNKSVSPAATEICNDGLDNNCDGSAGSCSPSGVYQQSTVSSTIFGHLGGDELGYSLAVGDINGDGLDDIVAGAPTRSASTGNDGGLYFFASTQSVGTALDADTEMDALVRSADRYDYLGDQAWVLPDLNQDGYDDVVVGEQQTTDMSLIYGPLTGSSTVTSNRDAVYNYAGPFEGAGHFHSTSGYADFLMGGATGGGAYLYTGGPTSTPPTLYATFTGIHSGDGAGDALAGGGDMDGDGYDDAWIGAYGDDSVASNSGAAYLVMAPVSGTVSLSTADAELRGLVANDQFGRGLHNPGDMNGDGLADVLVGAPGADGGGTDAGAIYLFEGVTSGLWSASSASAVIVGDTASDGIGYEYGIASGDVDDDGEVDLWIGTRENGNSAGKAWLLYGPLSGTIDLGKDWDAYLVGSHTVDWLGYRVAMGDTNGDGFDDLVTTAPYTSPGSNGDHGAVMVLLGGGL